MSERLNGPRAKFARALEHFDQLYAEIADFRKRNPYRTVTEDDPSTGDKVYRVEITENPPQRWSLIVGDCVHNLRSALDLLVWQLVAAGGGSPTNQTMFPVTREAKDFEPRMLSRVAGADKKAFGILKALKPYKGGNESIWRLHRLDANDKHQLLAVVGAAHRSVIFQMEVPPLKGKVPVTPPTLSLTPADTQFPLKHGDELFRINAEVRHALGKSPVRDDVQFAFEIALSDGEVVHGESVVAVLNELGTTVDEIINLFAPLLK